MSNKVDDILKELGLFTKDLSVRPTPPERVQRERGPCGKVLFASEGSAKTGARAVLKGGRGNTSFLRTYFCDECRGWHMTSSYYGEFAKSKRK